MFCAADKEEDELHAPNDKVKRLHRKLHKNKNKKCTSATKSCIRLKHTPGSSINAPQGNTYRVYSKLYDCIPEASFGRTKREIIVWHYLIGIIMTRTQIARESETFLSPGKHIQHGQTFTNSKCKKA